jgi:thymidine kinase
MLTVITGPMFAGKSSYLINLLIANKKVGREVLTFKPASDNRYGAHQISTHNNLNLFAISIQSPYEAFDYLAKAPKRVDLIGFDESQFFEPHHMQVLVVDLLKQNYDVICAGLAQNSFGEPFGAMGSLLSMADEIVQLPALCASCKRNKATRTYRKSDSTDRVLVGGSEDYEPRCYSCWSVK